MRNAQEVNYIIDIGSAALEQIELAVNYLKLITTKGSSANVSGNADVANAFDDVGLAMTRAIQAHELLDKAVWGMKELKKADEAMFTPRYWVFEDNEMKEVNAEEAARHGLTLYDEEKYPTLQDSTLLDEEVYPDEHAAAHNIL